MIDEGYIKYNAERRDGEVAYTDDVRNLSMIRTTLFTMGLIGVYPNGIGYGNLSIRTEGDSFVITGSATGGDMILKPEQFCLVESFDLEKNSVQSVGKIDASSESMSHGAVYKALPEVKTVVHIHSRKVFDYMLAGTYLRTDKSIPFGTPELAEAIADLVKAQPEPKGIFATAGHDEGIIAYGRNLDEVYDLIEEVYKRSR